MSDAKTDEFAGVGGSYVKKDGKRELVHRTAPAPAAAPSPVAPEPEPAAPGGNVRSLGGGKK